MSPRRPPTPHARAHLPALDADTALQVVNILALIERAIWRAHGPAMRALLDEAYERYPDAEPSPSSLDEPASSTEQEQLSF